MRRRGVPLLLACLLAAPAAAESVVLEATRDATLIEDPDGALANGSGPVFFVGRTAQTQNGIRRAVVHFDVAAALPPQAIVESAALTLRLEPSNAGTREIRLYRVQDEWGEGPSSSGGGGGAPAEPGDVTWLHTFHDWAFWEYAGGHFVARASAAALVDGPGIYTWESALHMAQDVALWARAAQRNHGWILIGDETTRQTAKSFASREHPDPALRPRLAITYRLPGARP